MKIIGYGLTTKGEAKRYMRATLEEFKRLCDDTIILLNNVGKEEIDLINEYGFKTVVDNREWGKTQNIIKQDFMKQVGTLKPDWLICLDMDEVFESRFTRQELEKITHDGWAFHFYIINLWNEGHRQDLNFWNVRMWKWTGNIEFENRPLHPGLAPKWAYQINQYAPFIVRHYGLKEKADRMEKVKRYEKYDPNAKYRSRSYYEALKTDNCLPYDEDKAHQEVDAYVKKYKPLIEKKPIMTEPRKYVIIRRFNRRTGEEFQFDVAINEVSRYLNQNTKELSFEVVGDVEDSTKELEKLFAEPTKGTPFKKFVPKRVKTK